MSDRLTRLRERMAAVGLNGFLVGEPVEDTFHTHSANRRYLSGFTGSTGWLLVTLERAFIAVDFRYFEQAERESPGLTLYRANGSIEKWLAPLIGEANLTGKKLGFEPAGATVAAFQAMTKAIDSLPAGERPKLLAAPPIVEELRAIKEPAEIEALQRAVDLGDEAFVAVSQRVEPGWTEREVAWEVERYAREHGADGMSFETIVAAGPWGAMPHAQPRERAIEAGEPIVIDMGVRVGGYCSDLTRTIVLGEPDERFREVYDIVLTAQLTAEELVASGMSGEEAHLLAHNVIAEAGYGENFGHGLGHGVGLLVHEAPRLARGSKDELKDGMVVTIEPGVYITGWGGVRIEDMAVMENGKARVMSGAPKVMG
ncbi:MAG TPA: aminopeptidase P family protein [Dehalococcoidia bacterium]|nr:aminopeptidase P family protein [Dehalococcoidia bacterium]